MQRILIILFLFCGNWLYSQCVTTRTLCGKWKLYYGIYDKNAPITPEDFWNGILLKVIA